MIDPKISPRTSSTVSAIGSRPPPAIRKEGLALYIARGPIQTKAGSGPVWVVRPGENVSEKLAKELTESLGHKPNQQQLRKYIADFAQANPDLKNLAAIVPGDRLMLPPPASVIAGWAARRSSNPTATQTSPNAAPAPQADDGRPTGWKLP